jgi:hypothetical protein
VPSRAAFPSPALLIAPLLLLATPAAAQTFAYRGFAEAGFVAHPQAAPNDPTQLIAEAQLRVEPSFQVRRLVSIAASIEGRIDSHRRTTERPDLRFWDRTLRRPSIAVRALTATVARGPVTIELGKQFLRWGQSDIISPTDYFTPRDYVVTVSSEPMAVTAARFTLAGAQHALELAYTPRMTPSRMPLLDHRWIGLGAAAAGLQLENAETRYSRRPQYGARWRYTGRVLEASASFFQGFNHHPLLDVAVSADGTARVSRFFAPIRALGADAVVPLPGITVKAEGAWQDARAGDADDYGLWVVQAERQQTDWLLIGGYVGEWVTTDRTVFGFAPDRGLARSVIGRMSRTFEGNRSALVEAVVRRDGGGLYARAEYSQAFAARWRVTVQALLVRGRSDDFLGQYRLNSFSGARTRVSF